MGPASWRHRAVALAVVGVAGMPIANAQDADTDRLAPVEIIGDSAQARELPGSGAVVEPEQLELDGTTDIHQALKTVPGMYVREEEGFGLRPNIGVRAAPPGRSSKVTIMEDGVLMAPAPYSNPAAYYFPTTKRLHSIEVLKGAPLLRHGPQTTGGVINLRSTPIPAERAGSIETVAGEHGGLDVHATWGDRIGDWSYMIETVQRRSDGFKDIDRSSRDTGFRIEDYVAKLRWDGARQSVELKAQHSEETSNETYLGLTDDDFSRDPDRRYGLSEIDQMNNDHQGVSLIHEFDWTPEVRQTSTVYRNEFARNWFKLDGNLLADANEGDADALGTLRGTRDTTGLEYKNNNREYVSQGVQTEFDLALGDHWIRTGVRYHEDEMDRFQPVEIYDQVNGSLVRQGRVEPSGGNNRFEDGEAWSLWVTDEWQVNDRLRLNLAMRYEDVKTSRVQYADASRNTVDYRRSNSYSEWLPGASMTFDVDDRWQLLAGVHRGFSPAGGGAESGTAPETSINWELGGRYRSGNLFAEAIGFHSDFTDQKEDCSVGSPCSDGSTSGTFTTGEAEISGVEVQAGTEFAAGSFQVPVSAAYTYTRARISSDNPASALEKGDRLQDIPRHQLNLRAGLEHPSGWDNHAVLNYTGASCSSVGCNNSDSDFDETESLMTVDLVSRYALTGDTDVFLRARNVFDEQRVVARTPYGARPNQPRTISVGLTHRF
ncbi:TonB-dependent receptor domain-containing protein [Thioalkalivibrio sp. ALE19]|uniref:TonB-dependent receptor family protein n=1 Tax=Thioalkalivibrio sp. ALE19 TaxID=1266909 RepID=UPI00040BA29E|nr:TonB-dependent receptor [Thioalkalivibrio sp. ALE19]